MLPWPGAYTKLDGHVLKVWKAEVAEPEQDAGPALPGTVLYTDKSRICVRTGDGVLALLEVQAEGKKRMGTDAFLRGTKIPAGTLLGA